MARIMKLNKKYRNQFFGTPEYLSPEVV